MTLNQYFITFCKNRSNRTTAIVNLVSFSVCISVFVLIALYINFEKSYDKHLPNVENTFRFTTDMFWESGAVQNTAVSPLAAGKHLIYDYPEITDATTFSAEFQQLVKPVNVVSQSEGFYEDNVLFVDDKFDNFFKIDLIAGAFDNAIIEPGKVILSDKKATQYFGNKNPIGEFISIGNHGKFEVAGLMKNWNTNTHIVSDILVSNVSLAKYKDPVWRDLDAYTYVRINSNSEINKIEASFDGFIKTHMQQYVGLVEFRLQPILDIHLKNDRLFDIAQTFNIKNLYFLGAIAVFILIIALINFVNLSILVFRNRAKEIGVRKVLGAKPKMLFKQFALESATLTFLAIICSVILIFWLFPHFKNLINYVELPGFFKSAYIYYAAILFLGAFIGALALININRSVPSAIISRSKKTIRGKSKQQRALVTIQFTLVIVLLIGITVSFNQLSFVRNKNLGFNNQNILNIVVTNDQNYQVSKLLKTELANCKSVVSVGLSNTSPGDAIYSDHFIIEGFENFRPLNTMISDADYMQLMGFEFLAGRNFNLSNSANLQSCIINETAMKKFGWSVNNTIGKKLSWNFGQSWDEQINGTVIGVVKDFHYSTLHKPIEELVITCHKNEFPIVSAKLSGHDPLAAINEIETIYKSCNPGIPMDFTFLDQQLQTLYADDYKMNKILTLFNVLAILISCIGLYSLVAVNIKNRIKEIGIRKVNGAKVSELVLWLNSDVVKWITLAFIIACPIAYWGMQKWLQNFAYKVNIAWWVFLLSGLAVLIISLGTISWQIFSAARRNPVEALRYE